MEQIKIVNPKQCAFYMSNGIKPINVYVDNLSGRLVYLFNKDDTSELWEKWKTSKPIK